MALVSVAVAACELGVSRSTLYALVRQRRIPHVKCGDRVLLSVEKVLAALEIPADNHASGPSVERTDGHRKSQ